MRQPYLDNGIRPVEKPKFEGAQADRLLFERLSEASQCLWQLVQSRRIPVLRDQYLVSSYILSAHKISPPMSGGTSQSKLNGRRH